MRRDSEHTKTVGCDSKVYITVYIEIVIRIYALFTE